jgi:hypothetical protein
VEHRPERLQRISGPDDYGLMAGVRSPIDFCKSPCLEIPEDCRSGVARKGAFVASDASSMAESPRSAYSWEGRDSPDSTVACGGGRTTQRQYRATQRNGMHHGPMTRSQ